MSVVNVVCPAGRDLCDGPIPRPGGPTECVCLSLNVISCDNKPSHLTMSG